MCKYDKNDELNIGKAIEYYSQAYASFYGTTLEKDRSILSVSAGGIGFLVAILTIAKEVRIHEFILFLLAAICFILTIFAIIYIFGKNGEYIISLTNDSTECDSLDCYLKLLDRIVTFMFSSGMILSLILGVSLTYNKITKEVVYMSNEIKSESNYDQINESVSGASLMKRSFSGSADMSPNVSPKGAEGESQNKTTERVKTSTTNSDVIKKD